jgi:hypothetical protein
MSKVRKYLSRAEQQSLVSNYYSSGLNKEAYCKQMGISASAFYRYQKKHSVVGSFTPVFKPAKQKFYVTLFGFKLLKLELSV